MIKENMLESFVLNELCHLTDREYILMFNDDLDTLEQAMRKIKS